LLRSENPISLSLPPFRGMTRKIVLWAAGIYILFAVLGLVLPAVVSNLQDVISLRPSFVRHGMIWLPFTYSFAPIMNFLSEAFALFSLWIFGAMLEEEFGGKWLREFLIVATAGGGFLACLVAYALAGRVPQFEPTLNRAVGMYPAVLALLLAFARYHGEQEMRLYFVVRIKAKYVAALYLLVYLVGTLGGARFDAATALCVALSGYLYLRFAPRRGLKFAASESWYGVRNAYLRSKRKRAGKKFEVYMKKQGKDVSTPVERRDPDDKRWMN
jgi:membrane associated rhomboid family serine protease